jgi:hypothetical protein
MATTKRNGIIDSHSTPSKKDLSQAISSPTLKDFEQGEGLRFYSLCRLTKYSNHLESFASFSCKEISSPSAWGVV